MHRLINIFLMLALTVLISACSVTAPVVPVEMQKPKPVVNLLLNDQKLDLAEPTLVEQVRRDASNVTATVNLGLLYTETGRVDQGIELLKGIVKHHPEVCEAQVRLGQLYRQAFKFDEAEAAYQRCLASQPEYPGALLNHGILLELYKGDLAGALHLYRRYQQTDGAGRDVDGWIADISRRLARQQQVAGVQK